MVSEESYHVIVLIIAVTRFIGSTMFLDFYLKHKHKRFLVLTLGFILWALNSALQFFLPTLDSLIDEPTSHSWEIKFVFILSEIFLSVGAFLFAIVLMNYSTALNERLVWLGLLPIIAIPLVLFPILTFEETFYATQIIDFIIVICLIPYIVWYRKPLQKIASNVPLFFLLLIVVAVLNFVSTVLIVEELIELPTRVAISFMLPFAFLHLEYNLLAAEKAKMKDKYSHNLSQLLQMVIGRIYLITNTEELSDKMRTGLEDIQADCIRISELIKLIREL
ncbi:MAG: hypothetical protein ACE5OZ_25330 [Candidatus Heimdallarchaeota archaeon]